METASEEFPPFLSSCYDRGKILVEDGCKDGGGKSGVSEVIYRPPKGLPLLNWHIEVIDGGTRREGDAVNFLAPCLRVLSIYPYQTVLISCRIKIR